jgi:hypothetical protein
VDPEIFVFLQRLRPELPLFPQLRSFAVPFGHPHITSISPFLSLSLEEVHFHASFENAIEFEVLHSKSPRLLKLSLSGYLFQKVLGSLPKFKQLEALELVYSSWASYSDDHSHGLSCLFQNSRHFKGLTTLSLVIPTGGPRLPVGFFPNIKVLKIVAPSSTITQVLSCTHNVEKAILDPLDASTEEWATIFGALSTASLRSIIVGARNSRVHLRHCLQPLLKGSLLAFEITCRDRSGISWDITDDDICDIVQGWPLLQRFVLPQMWERKTSLGFRSLHLLSSLRDLDLLRICIGGKMVRVPQDPWCKNGVSDEMSAYLDRIFPRYRGSFP